MVVRVNRFLAVEFTTPCVKQQNQSNRGWVLSWEYHLLLTENWDSQYEDYGEEDLNAEETEERDERLLNQFLANCLTTPISLDLKLYPATDEKAIAKLSF